jgi:translation initiation factor 4E
VRSLRSTCTSIAKHNGSSSGKLDESSVDKKETEIHEEKAFFLLPLRLIALLFFALLSQAGTPLNSGYSFWYMKRGKNTAPKEEPTEGGANPYESAIKSISTVKTVEEFWTTYNFLVRPEALSNGTDYHFFREGIKPTWEDPMNEKGGKWIIRLRKGLSSRYWEEGTLEEGEYFLYGKWPNTQIISLYTVLLALIGGQFPGVPEGEICGAVVSIRYNEDILGIWCRNSANRDVTERIRDAIKRVCQLPSHAHLEFKPHQAALQDKSSFRNTQVWKPKNTLDRSDSRGEGPRRSGSWGERDQKQGSSRWSR